MARYKMVSQTDTADGMEAAYREFYPNAHIPDVLRIPGFVGAQMLERVHAVTDRGAPYWKYMVIYDIDGATPQALVDELRRRSAAGELRGNPSLMTEVRRTVFYEPTTEALTGTPAATPGTRYKMIVQMDTPDEDEFNRYYAQVHVADVLKVPGVLGAQLFRKVHAMTDKGAPPWLHMVVYDVECADPAALSAEMTRRMQSGEMRANMALLKDERKSVYYRPVTEVMPGTPA